MCNINCLDTKQRHFIQFNLWKNCTIGCPFCCNIGHKRQTNAQKIEMIKYTINYIKNTIDNKFNEISLIGGELFDSELDDENVKNVMIQLIELLISKIKEKVFYKVCLATSLMFDINKNMIDILNIIIDKNVKENFLICTSYDSKFRFNTIQKKELWEKNIIYLNKLGFKTHTEIILSGEFIDQILNKQLTIKDICEKYKTNVDFLEPFYIEFDCNKQNTINRIPNFLPKRNNFLKFIKMQCIDNNFIDIERLLAIQLRPELLIFMDQNGKIIKQNRSWENKLMKRMDSNGVEHFPGSYEDSNIEMIDDILKFSKIKVNYN